MDQRLNLSEVTIKLAVLIHKYLFAFVGFLLLSLLLKLSQSIDQFAIGVGEAVTNFLKFINFKSKYFLLFAFGFIVKYLINFLVSIVIFLTIILFLFIIGDFAIIFVLKFILSFMIFNEYIVGLGVHV